MMRARGRDTQCDRDGGGRSSGRRDSESESHGGVGRDSDRDAGPRRRTRDSSESSPARLGRRLTSTSLRLYLLTAADFQSPSQIQVCENGDFATRRTLDLSRLISVFAVSLDFGSFAPLGISESDRSNVLSHGSGDFKFNLNLPVNLK
jgi:hypothetical protein